MHKPVVMRRAGTTPYGRGVIDMRRLIGNGMAVAMDMMRGGQELA